MTWPRRTTPSTASACRWTPQDAAVERRLQQHGVEPCRFDPVVRQRHLRFRAAQGLRRPIANFETYKLDYAYRKTLAGGSGITLNAANQYYTPKATSTATTGEISNVDNRYQTITVNSTTSVAAGDAFTIAGVNEVHHITKADTGTLKQFRVISVLTSTTMVISPPIISNGGATDAELQYKNCSATPASTAAIVWLNTVTGSVNPFWQADAFEIVPGHYQPKDDSGLAIMGAATSNGVYVSMARQGAIGDLSTKYRWDVFYGLVNKQPEMTGVMMFSQT
jgi:hypothetical protein